MGLWGLQPQGPLFPTATHFHYGKLFHHSHRELSSWLPHTPTMVNCSITAPEQQGQVIMKGTSRGYEPKQIWSSSCCLFGVLCFSWEELANLLIQDRKGSIFFERLITEKHTLKKFLLQALRKLVSHRASCVQCKRVTHWGSIPRTQICKPQGLWETEAQILREKHIYICGKVSVEGGWV